MKVFDGLVFIAHPNPKGISIDLEERELVMCKNCKHRQEYIPGPYRDASGRIQSPKHRNICMRGNRKDPEDDWWCADGAKRDED